jgi:hypothetical protein
VSIKQPRVIDSMLTRREPNCLIAATAVAEKRQMPPTNLVESIERVSLLH